MNRKLRVIRTGILTILLLLAVSCRRSGSKVETVGAAAASVHATGYLEPRGDLRRLAFDVQGVISQLPCEIGDEVREGDVLAVLDDEVEKAELAVARTRLAAFEAEEAQILSGAHPDEIRATSALRDAADFESRYRESERARLEGLFNARAVPQTARDRAVYDADATRAKLDEATAALARLKNQVRQEDRALAHAKVEDGQSAVAAALARLARKTLKAPVAGTVVEIFRRQGEGISASLDEPVILLSPQGGMEVRVEVNQRFITRIARGADVSVSLPGDPVPRRGTVRTIKPIAGKKTVFARQATERMDVQIVEARIALLETPPWPIGIEVEVTIDAGTAAASSSDLTAGAQPVSPAPHLGTTPR